MKITSKVNLKCSHCGGAKYIDDPYAISSEWYVDVVCIRCGHSKTIEAKVMQDILTRIGNKKRANRQNNY